MRNIKSCTIHAGIFMRRWCHASSVRDPAPLFFRPDVQNLMLEMNEKDVERVFRPKKLEQRFRTPHYQFMTQEQLAKAQERCRRRMEGLLQPPPVMLPRQPIDRLISRDPALRGFMKNGVKLICVDVSTNISDRKRMCVVREADGDLRVATWEERARLCQLFMPVVGREAHTPRMFSDEHLQPILERQDYLFVLDRACLQFEPDDPLYISVTSATYNHVDQTASYQQLQSTRHLGSLVFYLTWNRKVDNLLLHLINAEQIQTADKVVQLHHCLHPQQPISVLDPSTGSQSASDTSSLSEDPSSDEDEMDRCIASVQEYVESASVKRPMLELALQKFCQLVEQRRLVQRDVQRAHGVC